MKRWQSIGVVLVSGLLLLGCIAGLLLLASLSGWLLFGSESAQIPLIRRIATVGPIEMTTPTQQSAVSTPGVVSVATVPASVENTPSSAVTAATETRVVPPTPIGTPIGEPVPVSNSESPEEPQPGPEVLDYALPPGSVSTANPTGLATRLVIPKMSLDAPVVLSPIKNQTWQVDHLGQAIGHLEGTAQTGANSNLVLAGHITMEDGSYGPFAGLDQLAAGDTMTVYVGDQPFQYVVEGYQTVARTAVEVTFPTDTPQITLITCNTWNRDASRYENRLVVTGHLLTN